MGRDNRRTRRRAAVAAMAAALLAGAAATAAAATAPAGSGTVTADGSIPCTTQNSKITPAADQLAQPWEIAAAGLQQLSTGPHPATGQGVTVAVVDTGLDRGDAQVFAGVVGGRDFTGSGGYDTDSDGHGTMVASIIAARPSARNAMVGIAPQAKLLIYREAGCAVAGGNDEASMAAAINAAVAAGARVINISQDGYTADQALRAAVVNAYQNNVVVVTSAGNNGSSAATQGSENFGVDPTTYPAAYAPYLLAVGAADRDAAVPSFSESGQYVGLVAPGVAVGALFPNGRIMLDDGTSFAAPYVAAVAALVIQQHPSWPAGTVIKVLEATASGDHRWSASGGWGEVNPVAALNADPAALPGLYGAGPNADGPAAAAPPHRGSAMAPIVSAPTPQIVLDQRKGAYLALAGAALAVALAGIGTVVARDARARRRPAR